MKPVILDLVGLDGNAFALLGAFQRAARRQGRAPEEVKAVMDAATAGDYNTLLNVLMENTCVPEDLDEDAAPH